LKGLSAIKSRIEAFDIPVLRQEMRIRQRGGRSFGVMLAYTGILSFIALVVLFTSDLTGQHLQQSGAAAMARAGHDIFTGLTFAQLVMVILVVPAYSAGVISMEREKGSFDLLVLTILGSGSIITQKFAAALAQVMMLLVASIPVLSIVFLLGGVSPGEVALAYTIIILTAAAVNALGVMCSCYFANTRAATFTTYLVTVLFLAGLPIANEILQGMSAYGSRNASTNYALSITLGVAFSAGIISVFLFGIVALILRKLTGHWRSRTFRMWTFGATYAVVLLAFNIPSVCWAIINSMQIGGMFALLYINAFVAMAVLIDPYAAHSINPSLIIAPTLLFSAGCAYLFRNLSINRFNAIRRV
jgi:hypothetical protein